MAPGAGDSDNDVHLVFDDFWMSGDTPSPRGESTANPRNPWGGSAMEGGRKWCEAPFERKTVRNTL